MSWILKINGLDIADLNLGLLDSGSLWSAPRIDRDSAAPIGMVGTRPAALATSDAKRLAISLSLPGTMAERRARLDQVLWHLDGLLVLEWADAPDREQYARATIRDGLPRMAQLSWLDGGQVRLNFELVMDTPLSFSSSPTVLAIGTTAVETPLGTATSAPVIELPGAISGAVTLTYRGITGSTLASVVISNPALGGSGALIVDSARERIWKWDGTTLTDARNLYSSGSFPVLDPGDGDPAAGVWPTLESTHAGSATYRRAWE